MTQYVHRSWQVREGLPQNAIQAMAQTPDGYLWLATDESLVRFDGVRFTPFYPEHHPGLVHNYAETLLTARDGSLWIGTHKGLSRLHQRRFTAFTIRDGLAGDVIRGLAEDASGVLWIATSTGLSRYQHGRFTNYTTRDGLPTDNLTALIADGASRLWIATEAAGLVRFERNRFTVYPGCQGPGSDAVLSLARRRDGGLWAGTAAGLCRMETGVLRPVALPGAPVKLEVRALQEDQDGNLWVGTTGGVFRVTDRGAEAYTQRHGLTNNLVTTLLEDREGSLWIGTDGGGLNQLRAGSFLAVSVPEGLPSPHVHSILEARDGSLWIATREGGLARFSQGRRTVYTMRDGLASSDVAALAETRDGTLWVGTSAGLCRFQAGRFIAYTRSHGLPHDNVRVLHADRRDDLWIGTMDGVARFRDGAFTRYGTAEGMPAARTWAIAETRDGALWFGGMATRVSRLKDGAFTLYGEADGVTGPVLALHEDSSGTLWAGTGHSGLLRFHDGRFQVVTKAQGLHDSLVVSIVDDHQGHLWMTCNRGIFRVSRQELNAVADGRRAAVRSRVFDTADGMRSAECNGTTSPSSFRTRDGRLWFPTIDGAVSVDPRRLTTARPPSRPTIESVRVRGEEVALEAGLRLPPGADDLEIAYTAPSFRVPERTTFRYRLDGFDSEWVEAGTRRTAFYTRVPPGQYTFRVKAQDENGATSDAEAVLAFHLVPRFYQTAWFRTVGVLMALGLVAAAHRARLFRRLRRLQEREHELGRRVEEALARVKILTGLLPICASCKKIRDDKGYWSQIETYITHHSDAQFSHGICPDCLQHLYGTMGTRTKTPPAELGRSGGEPSAGPQGTHPGAPKPGGGRGTQ